ncbi:MAG: restriction endonuclease subunit S [bacterium]|nr:restriction endonuclease subunit S [bacterium]
MSVVDNLERTLRVPIAKVASKAATWNPARERPSDYFTYVDLSSVDQSTKAIVEPRDILGSEAPSRARQIIETGNVLVATVRPNLNGVARVTADLDGATASTGFCVIKPNPNALDSGYLFHWVKTPQFVADMVRKSTGANYPAVSDRIIFESAIPLPPLFEQKRIAEILDRAEALRSGRRAALALLDELTQSIFLDMFGDPVGNPKRWEMKSLQDAGVETKTGPFGSLLHKSDYITNGVPLINPKHMVDGRVEHTGDETVSEEKARKLSAYRLKDGDILMARRGEMGRCVVVKSHQEGWLCGTGSFFIRAPESVYLSEFLELALSSEPMRKHLENLSGRAIMPSLSGNQIKSLRLPLPPIEIQHSFVAKLEKQKAIVDAQRRHLNTMDTFFASLQQRAFRGEL